MARMNKTVKNLFHYFPNSKKQISTESESSTTDESKSGMVGKPEVLSL